MPLRRAMPPWGKSLRHSLGVRLFVWLFLVIVVAFGGYALMSVRTTAAEVNTTVSEAAQRFSHLVRRSTRQAMLLNRKEDVHRIVETIAGEPGVEGVRIYDKQGRIIVSNLPEEVGHAVDFRAEACIGCHDVGGALRHRESNDRVRVFDTPDSGRILGLIESIPNEPACSQAACHAHPVEQTVLGVLDVRMSFAHADARVASAKRQLLVAGLLLACVVGIASGGFIATNLRRPVRRLIDGVERVAGGDLDSEIAVDRRDELGHLARAFNDMTSDLRRARSELRGWSERLEQKLVEKSKELGRTQRQVAHMDKMASLGKLAATVAHELNNPLAGIFNYAKLVERTLRDADLPPEVRTDLERSIGLIRQEAWRSGEIVRNLLLFARRSGGEFALHRLNDIVERSVMLVRHHLEVTDVHLDRTALPDDDPGVVCDAGQIEQALVALFVNAVEAMPDGGTLGVSLTGAADEVALEVRDSGVGIPRDALPQVFEPFFSTKEKTSGVGLGLAVVYGIVRRHGGHISVDSDEGRGTTFRIVLPRRPPQDDGSAEDAPEEPRHVESNV